MAFGPYRRSAPQWLKSTIAQSRQDLAVPNLKWYVSQQSPPAEEGLDRIDITADLAQLAVADAAIVPVKVFELEPLQEKLVLGTEGVVRLGEALARSYLGQK